MMGPIVQSKQACRNITETFVLSAQARTTSFSRNEAHSSLTISESFEPEPTSPLQNGSTP